MIIIVRPQGLTNTGADFMEENLVIFKGTKNGLTVILKENTDFLEIKQQLSKKVKELKGFFAGSKLFIRFNRQLNETETKELLDIIVNDGGVEVLMVSSDEQTVSVSEAIANVSEHLIGGDTNFYKGTLRSGQSINFFGNVVIVGDVNAGAEIIAGGNVLVLGILRGMVHAGVPNNNDAFVFALNFQPTQLRIGEIIARSPDNESIRGLNPEIATVKDDIICINRINVDK